MAACEDQAQPVVGKHFFFSIAFRLRGDLGSLRNLFRFPLEALIAALYFDAGIEATRQFVNRWVIGDGAGDPQALEAEIMGAPIVDFKSALQELAQARKLPPPRYVIVKERGPEHSKTFTIEVRLGRDWTGQAEGFSKKSAAQNAARDVLSRLMEQSP